MKVSLLFSKGAKWVSGLGLHGNPLALVHYTPSTINSDLGNARQCELAFQTARSVTLSVSNNLLSARSTAVLYTEKARTHLRTFLGERWSTRWAQAGFTNRTLSIPKNTPGVISLVRALQSYFTSNPAHQNAEAGVTAQAAGTQLAALESGVTALNNAKRDQRTKRESRENTHKTLRQNLGASRKEVESVLKKEDPRWLDLIDKVPGDLRAPEPVSDVVAEPGMPGHGRLSWLPSLRADWYVIEVAAALHEAFEPVTAVHDTVADVELTPGATVRIRIKARNAAGESGPSPVVELTVPVAAAA